LARSARVVMLAELLTGAPCCSASAGGGRAQQLDGSASDAVSTRSGRY